MTENTNLTNLTILEAIEKTFDGYFSRSSFLNSSTVILSNEQDEPVAIFQVNETFIVRSVFYNENIFNQCMPQIKHTKKENELLLKAYTSFCKNDALVHMIKTNGSFDIAEIVPEPNSQKKEYVFYNSCLLTEIEFFHDVPRMAFYYSYDKHMLMDNKGVFHPVLLLSIYIKQKIYSIYLSPELNKAANFNTFTGNKSSAHSLRFEQLFEHGVEIVNLNQSIDPLWTYDIFFYYIDALLKNRPLVDSILDSFSTYEDAMNLIEMHLI